MFWFVWVWLDETFSGYLTDMFCLRPHFLHRCSAARTSIENVVYQGEWK